MVLPRLYGLCKAFDRARKVVRMNDIQPGPVRQLLSCFAVILQGLAVDKLRFAHCTRRMHEPRNIVDDLAPGEFIRLQHLLSQLAILDLYIGSVPSDDFPGSVAQWIGAKYEPAISSIETAHSRFHIKWCTRSQTRAPRFQKAIAVLRINGCRPSPARGLFRGHGCEIKPGTIAVIDYAFRRGTPKHPRNGLGYSV
jgi:hypothetical protein